VGHDWLDRLLAFPAHAGMNRLTRSAPLGNEAAAKANGVKRVCIPQSLHQTSGAKHEQAKPWFRNSQKWRTGREGRISVIKRRHGLNRCQDAFGASVGRRAFGRRDCL
jgi:hypothetical protein